jgi:hypothetical protein
MRFDRAVSAGAAVLLPVALSCPASAEAARAERKDASGKDVGAAEFSEMPGGVLIKVTAGGLAPGDHAIHVHAVAVSRPEPSVIHETTTHRLLIRAMFVLLAAMGGIGAMGKPAGREIGGCACR